VTYSTVYGNWYFIGDVLKIKSFKLKHACNYETNCIIYFISVSVKWEKKVSIFDCKDFIAETL